MAPQTNRYNLLVGLADICELMAATWAFPLDGALAAALADGTYAADLRGCLTDAGARTCEIEAACDALDALARIDVNELAAALRRGHSALFCAPGASVPVWPYEAAFRFVAQGRAGAPSLFRSPIELDVERMMREAGVLPEHARTEPPDSVWGEYGFMAYLLARAAGALQAGDAAGCELWRGRASAFAREHMAAWMPAFFEHAATEAQARSHGAYAALANVGSACWNVLANELVLAD